MNAKSPNNSPERRSAISRRSALLLALSSSGALAQGFGGLGATAPGFAIPRPGMLLAFPRDHGAHPEFRTEWWYVTANLTGDDGASYGVQWTLFRFALQPNAARAGWDDRNVWMGHAAATSAREHLFAQKFARGGIEQAGVEAAPFRAYLDDWVLETRDDSAGAGIERLRVSAGDKNFAYALDLTATGPIVLQGEDGYSRKSEAGQASYYYSQPFFTAEGSLSMNGRKIQVSGRAWMDREWSSQPLGPDQKGWDWFSLRLDGGAKLMLYRMRSVEAAPFLFGNWIDANGATSVLAREDIVLEPLETTRIADRDVPIRWRVKIKSRGVDVETRPLNPRSWMGTDFAYWEGPIRFTGSRGGEGYLEMTGY
ncbi:lipocalin-like domain-containing protein [Methylocystis hirsuta]|uniref:Iron ABC transporter permease n=1 Tax=Methylocystis hirsuta TaxID=369798 RepID=A0A3M9XTR4_9HYPH|nr:lipocalin-like domain-containing protein [Methylocystis hirsuta]RNJ51026.1 iron ABC transporter permease [Methylocystis hirsuta]